MRSFVGVPPLSLAQNDKVTWEAVRAEAARASASAPLGSTRRPPPRSQVRFRHSATQGYDSEAGRLEVELPDEGNPPVPSSPCSPVGRGHLSEPTGHEGHRGRSELAVFELRAVLKRHHDALAEHLDRKLAHQSQFLEQLVKRSPGTPTHTAHTVDGSADAPVLPDHLKLWCHVPSHRALGNQHRHHQHVQAEGPAPPASLPASPSWGSACSTPARVLSSSLELESALEEEDGFESPLASRECGLLTVEEGRPEEDAGGSGEAPELPLERPAPKAGVRRATWAGGGRSESPARRGPAGKDGPDRAESAPLTRMANRRSAKPNIFNQVGTESSTTPVTSDASANETTKRKTYQTSGRTFQQAELMRMASSYRVASERVLAGRSASRIFPSLRVRVNIAVHASYFEAIMCIVIMSNVLFFGVEAEIMARRRLADPPQYFKILSAFYSVVFLIEITLRLYSDGKKFFFEEGWVWNIFDLIVVLGSALEVVTTMAFQNDGVRSISSLRILRIIRTMRLLRAIRVMRYFRSLRILLASVVSTLRSLMWTMLMLLTILYLFGIVFTQAVTQYLIDHPTGPRNDELVRYYSHLHRAIFTLFKSIAGGVSWQEVAEPLGSIHFGWVLLFLVYIFFTVFAVLNVVTGVFCQTAIESAHMDQDMVIQSMLDSEKVYTMWFKEIFNLMDTRNTGTITLSQFEDGMQDDAVQAYFASMELTVSEAFHLFKLLDTEETHIIDVDKFIKGCMKLRGSAKSIDIAMLMYQSQWASQRCIRTLGQITKQMKDLHSAFLPVVFERESSGSAGTGDGGGRQERAGSACSSAPGGKEMLQL